MIIFALLINNRYAYEIDDADRDQADGNERSS